MAGALELIETNAVSNYEALQTNVTRRLPLIGEDIAGNGDQSAANNQRPNLVPGQPLYIASSAPPFRVANPAAFAVPAAGTYGDAGRNILRASGLRQLDASLFKTMRASDRISVQFRAEFFNVYNHANFATPRVYASFSPAQCAKSASGGSSRT